MFRPQEGLPMFIIHVILQVQNPDDVAAVREDLRAAGALSRQEPGCHEFSVSEDLSNPQNFLLFERWESKEAWEVHKQAEAFLTIYQPKVLPKVSREPYFCSPVE